MLHLIEMPLVHTVTKGFLFSSYDERQDWLQKFLLEVLSSSWTLITSFRFKMSLEQFEQVLLGRAGELADEMYSVTHGVEQKS